MNPHYVFRELKKDFDYPIFNKENSIIIKHGDPFLKYTKNTDIIEIFVNNDNEILRLIFETFDKNFTKDFEVTFKRVFKDLSLMVDMARNNVMNLITLKQVVRYSALMGYTSFKIYLEDVFEVDEEPYFGYRRGKYSKNELKEFVEYANYFGIEVVPCIQTLAHLNGLKKLPIYKDIFDIDDILLVDEQKTYDLIDNIFKTVKEVFGGTRINLGMDEAHRLGRGKYLDAHEYLPRKDIFMNHLSKVLEISKKYDYEPEIWSDMFFNSHTFAYETFGHVDETKVDPNLKLVYRDYFDRDVNSFSEKINIHKEITNNIGLAGGTWKWLGFCPNNHYAFINLTNFIEAGIKSGVKEFTVTCWGDDGGETSIFSVLPSINLAANLNNLAVKDAKHHLFKELTGKTVENYMKLDLLMKCDMDFSKFELNSLNRILLYSDPLLGLYDSLINKEQVKLYKFAAEELQKEANDNTKFAYLFELESKLAKLLSYKVDIGINLRNAYSSKDKNKIKDTLVQINNSILSLDEFYNSFYKVRHKEAKSSGFQVNDLRLGGLKFRLLDAKRKVERYIDGEIDSIEELEEETLDFFGGITKFKKENSYIEAKYSYMSTNNVNE